MILDKSKLTSILCSTKLNNENCVKMERNKKHNNQTSCNKNFDNKNSNKMMNTTLKTPKRTR